MTVPPERPNTEFPLTLDLRRNPIENCVKLA